MSAALLVRIDDRLIHGQVLLGWAPHFEPGRIVLGNDAAAADAPRRALYQGLAEGDVEIDVLPLETLARELQAPEPRRRTFVVLESVADARRLVELGAPLAQVQIGGLHAGEGKKRLLDYVYLSPEESHTFQWLLEQGITLEARDLPNHRGVSIDRAMLTRLWP